MWQCNHLGSILSIHENLNHAAPVLLWRVTELIGIPRVITDEKGNESHMSITFIQHSLKRHSPFRPAGSLQNAAIVTLSDGCTLRITFDGSSKYRASMKSPGNTKHEKTFTRNKKLFHAQLRNNATHYLCFVTYSCFVLVL